MTPEDIVRKLVFANSESDYLDAQRAAREWVEKNPRREPFKLGATVSIGEPQRSRGIDAQRDRSVHPQIALDIMIGDREPRRR